AARHHVRRGEEEAVGADDDGAPPAAAAQPQVRDGGHEPLRHRGDRARVRVQRLGVRDLESHAASVARARKSPSLSISPGPVRRHAEPDQEVTMKYVALIYADPDGWDAVPEAEQQRVMEKYMALAREPVSVGGDQLQDAETATTVRVRDGETLTTD